MHLVGHPIDRLPPETVNTVPPSPTTCTPYPAHPGLSLSEPRTCLKAALQLNLYYLRAEGPQPSRPRGPPTPPEPGGVKTLPKELFQLEAPTTPEG